MMSGAYFQGGAAESSATNQQDQGLAPKCGENRPVEAKRENSAAPAPSLREKLKAIRDSDHPAAPWARNIVQIMDTMEKDDPDALRALGHATAMFEKAMNGLVNARHQLTPDEIAALFGLRPHGPRGHQ